MNSAIVQDNNCEIIILREREYRELALVAAVVVAVVCSEPSPRQASCCGNRLVRHNNDEPTGHRLRYQAPQTERKEVIVGVKVY